MQPLRYTAFSADPAGGNPAGIVLDARGANDTEMLHIAADLGYSETAFLVPTDERRFAVRYFSPLAEVPFCGHATIASAVALAERDGAGPIVFDTPVGRIEVTVQVEDGRPTATLTSSARPPPSSPAPTTRSSPRARVSGWPRSTTTSTRSAR